MLLSEAKTRCLSYLNDDNTRFSDTLITAALRTALDEVIITYSNMGGSLFDTVEDVSAVQGVADVSLLDPIAIRSVSRSSGSSFYPLYQVDRADLRSTLLQDTTLRIHYVGRPEFPTNDGYDIEWTPGGMTDIPVADSLLVLKATSALMPIDNEQIAGMAELENRYMQNLLLLSRMPQGRIMTPYGNGYSSTFNPSNVWTYVPYNVIIGNGGY
jgi:hypothetical protein